MFWSRAARICAGDIVAISLCATLAIWSSLALHVYAYSILRRFFSQGRKEYICTPLRLGTKKPAIAGLEGHEVYSFLAFHTSRTRA